MDLPLATLLEAPRIRQLARIISSGNVGSLSSSLVAIQPNGTKSPLFCVPPDSRAKYFSAKNYRVPWALIGLYSG